MKKIILMLAAAAALACSMNSCSDFDSLLEEKNYGNPTIDEMIANEENVVLLAGQCYADLKWIHDHWGYWGLVTISADEGLCVPRNGGNDWNDGGYWLKQNTHTWDFRGEAIKNIWDTTISGAMSCNLVLKTLNQARENMSEETYAQYVGEVEVLRTYYFYLLFECFGRIPYTEKYEEFEGPLSEPWDVWSNLVAVLERNAPNMAVVKTDADRTKNYGRTTQGFAYGLLARLYLNAESYGCKPENVFKNVEAPEQYKGSFMDNCIRCCDNVINSRGYSIEKNYFTNYKINNENSKEIILAIVDNGMGDFDARSNGKMSNKLRVVMNTHHYGVQYCYGMLTDTWNGFCARPDFIALYDESDVRGIGYEQNGTGNKKDWGWFVGPVYKAGATAEDIASRSESAMFADEDHDKAPTIIHVEVSSLTDAHNFDGARLNKWEIDKTSTYAYCENDFILMRYADVLWMKEEAILRGGAGTSGYNTDDFKTLRERSFAYGDKDGNKVTFEEKYPELATLEVADLDFILDERGREFTWEMVRRRDLIRFEKYGTIQYVDKNSEDLNWYPIPKSVLEKSLVDKDGNRYWTQNKGYEGLN